MTTTSPTRAGRSTAPDDLLGGGWPAGLADGELIRRYVEGDRLAGEVAFEVIVRRHGPMVLGLCRRLTGDEPLAEDAFQATFLALARRASGLRRADSLAPWLRSVGRRVANRARHQARRRRARETPLIEVAVDDPADARELREVIDRELAALPTRYRSAIVLCDLEGMPHGEAAGVLGVAVGTVGSRLHRGRELLRKRLVRRGLGPATSAALASTPRAALSRELLGRTLSMVAQAHAGGAVPPAIEAMIRGGRWSCSSTTTPTTPRPRGSA